MKVIVTIRSYSAQQHNFPEMLNISIVHFGKYGDKNQQLFSCPVLQG